MLEPYTLYKSTVFIVFINFLGETEYTNLLVYTYIHGVEGGTKCVRNLKVKTVMAEGYSSAGAPSSREWITIRDLFEGIGEELCRLSAPKIRRAIDAAREKGLVSDAAHRDLSKTTLDSDVRATRFLSAVHDEVAKDPSAYERFIAVLRATNALGSLVERMSRKLSELGPPRMTASPTGEPLTLTIDSGMVSNESTSAVTASVATPNSAHSLARSTTGQDTDGGPSVSEPNSLATNGSDSSASTILPIVPTFLQYPSSSVCAPTLEQYSISPDVEQASGHDHALGTGDPEEVNPQIHSQETDQARHPIPELQRPPWPPGSDMMVNAVRRPGSASAGIDAIRNGVRSIREELRNKDEHIQVLEGEVTMKKEEAVEHVDRITTLEAEVDKAHHEILQVEKKLKASELKLEDL